jgi:hypothetical protein
MNRTTIAVALLCVAISWSVAASAEEAKTRTWSDATGAFTLEAEIVKFADGKVHLRRTNGKVITVELERLSSADQQYVRELGSGEAGPKTATVSQLTGEAEELANDDGDPAGKKSLPRGIAAAFKAPEGEQYFTSVRIHGSRYGSPQPPKEDFHVTLCDSDFKPIADFDFPYKKFDRGDPEWVALRVKPTQVPEEFVICLNFAPTQTKGVFVSHDAEGKSLVGLPDKPAGAFTGGDWMVRVTLDQLKSEE